RQFSAGVLARRPGQHSVQFDPKPGTCRTTCGSTSEGTPAAELTREGSGARYPRAGSSCGWPVSTGTRSSTHNSSSAHSRYTDRPADNTDTDRPLCQSRRARVESLLAPWRWIEEPTPPRDLSQQTREFPNKRTDGFSWTSSSSPPFVSDLRSSTYQTLIRLRGSVIRPQTNIR